MIDWLVPLAGATAIVFAALMLLQNSLYAAAVCFLTVILQVALLLYASGARLLASLLVLVYAGAVAVLIVVSIQAAASSRRPGANWSRLSAPRPLLLASFLLVCGEAALLLLHGQAQAPSVVSSAVDFAVGQSLFGPYAAVTEGAALLMFLAALAVIGIQEPGG